jgi:hypothetical protein
MAQMKGGEKSLPMMTKDEGSYFASCERDKQGHCLPSGKQGEKKPGKTSKPKPQPSSKKPGMSASEASGFVRGVMAGGKPSRKAAANLVESLSSMDLGDLQELMGTLNLDISEVQRAVAKKIVESMFPAEVKKPRPPKVQKPGQLEVPEEVSLVPEHEESEEEIKEGNETVESLLLNSPMDDRLEAIRSIEGISGKPFVYQIMLHSGIEPSSWRGALHSFGRGEGFSVEINRGLDHANRELARLGAALEPDELSHLVREGKNTLNPQYSEPGKMREQPGFLDAGRGKSLPVDNGDDLAPLLLAALMILVRSGGKVDQRTRAALMKLASKIKGSGIEPSSLGNNPRPMPPSLKRFGQ